jgi:hypothetical protein
MDNIFDKIKFVDNKENYESIDDYNDDNDDETKKNNDDETKKNNKKINICYCLSLSSFLLSIFYWTKCQNKMENYIIYDTS